MVTQYIAEFVNCITSFAYGVWAPWHPPRQDLKKGAAADEIDGHIVYYAFGFPSIPFRKANLPEARGRFDSFSVALCLVGLCSAAFHGTLDQGAQFTDDLSMLALSACLIQRLYAHGQTPAIADFVTRLVYLATLAGTCRAYVLRSTDNLYDSPLP